MSNNQRSTLNSSPGDSIFVEVKMFVKVLNNVEAFICIKNLDGLYTYVNQPVLDLFNKNLVDVIGFDDSHFFDIDFAEQLNRNDLKVMSEGVGIESE